MITCIDFLYSYFIVHPIIARPKLGRQLTTGACIEHTELQSSPQLRDILPVAYRSGWALQLG